MSYRKEIKQAILDGEDWDVGSFDHWDSGWYTINRWKQEGLFIINWIHKTDDGAEYIYDLDEATDLVVRLMNEGYKSVFL